MVGHSFTTGDLAQHAFLRAANGGLTDLNNLLVAGSGATVVEAGGLNDLGQIAATATSPANGARCC